MLLIPDFGSKVQLAKNLQFPTGGGPERTLAEDALNRGMPKRAQRHTHIARRLIVPLDNLDEITIDASLRCPTAGLL